MITQEAIAELISVEVLKIYEAFGPEIANAFLAGIKYAASIKEEVLKYENFNITEVLGEFYSDMSKGGVS